MILLCGLPTDRPFALALETVAQLGVDHVVADQRRAEECELEWEVADGELRGLLTVAGRGVRLEELSGVYLRLLDFGRLLGGEPARLTRALALARDLQACCELSAARVANREEGITSNASKVFQALAIRRAGFEIPETLVTSEPAAVRAFAAAHGRVIYKSVGGERSIVTELSPADLRRGRLAGLRQCPVQFQAYVPGDDVRVHTVGDEVFATAVRSAGIDYRYAHRDGAAPATRAPTRIDDEVAERCLRLAGELRLSFAGIDLRLAPDGRVYCFEVNPQPAFSYYQDQSGQPIGHALVRWLAGGPDAAPAARPALVGAAR